MGKEIRVLIVEDSEDDALLLVRELRQGGYSPAVVRVDTAKAMSEALAGQSWDIIICDYSMPNFSAPAALAVLKKTEMDVPFVIVSGKIGEDTAVAAMRAGAHDYIMKDNLARLVPAVEREVRDAAGRGERRKAEAALRAREEQLRIAREIQQRLFPSKPPVLPGFEIGGASYPAEATGGDYFDYVPMREDCLGIVIGDVSGHGLGPALLMAEARAYLRTLAHTYANVSEILRNANYLLCEDLAIGQFITLFYACICPRTRTMVYASAGHTPGYVLDPSGKTKVKLDSTDFPLGVDVRFEFAVAPPVSLSSGDVIVLLTDGVVEARGPKGELFGVERALDVVRPSLGESAPAIVEALRQKIHEFSGHARQLDDITAVVVKVGPVAGT